MSAFPPLRRRMSGPGRARPAGSWLDIGSCPIGFPRAERDSVPNLDLNLLTQPPWNPPGAPRSTNPAGGSTPIEQNANRRKPAGSYLRPAAWCLATLFVMLAVPASAQGPAPTASCSPSSRARRSWRERRAPSGLVRVLVPGPWSASASRRHPGCLRSRGRQSANHLV